MENSFYKNHWTLNGFDMLKKFKSDLRGIAAIEMALILPIMLLLLVGMADAYNAFNAKRITSSVTSTISDLVARSLTGIQRGRVVEVLNAVDQLFEPFDPQDLTLNIYVFRGNPTSGAIETRWAATRERNVVTVTNGANGAAPGNCGAAPVLSAQTQADLLNGGPDVILAQACHGWTPRFAQIAGFSSIGSLNLAAENNNRARSGNSVECINC